MTNVIIILLKPKLKVTIQFDHSVAEIKASAAAAAVAAAAAATGIIIYTVYTVFSILRVCNNF